MKQYIELCERILANGEHRNDRTGTGTTSLFGEQLRFDLRQGFPLLTTKRVYYKAVVAELIWFLKGDTNIEWLNQNGCTIWDEWADENGNLGRVYGAQWRNWIDPHQQLQTIDQIANVVKSIQENPDSRRHIVSAWNVADLPYMALPPCHTLFQFYCGNDNTLSLHLYQRSADVFLGLPFNIASYALLLEMIASYTDRTAKELIISIGDAHIYDNHIAQVKEQLSRTPRELPTLAKKLPDWRFNAWFREIIEGMPYDEKMEDELGMTRWCSVENYNPHPTIKADVSV